MTQRDIDVMDMIVNQMVQGKTLSAALKDVYTKRNVGIKYHDEWLSCGIKTLNMSMRTTSALLGNRINTINDVVNYTNDVVNETKKRSITNLQTFGRISAIELFESILDYCWNQMSRDEKTAFLIDVVERNSDNLRPEIAF
jgi:hypothetical protein